MEILFTKLAQDDLADIKAYVLLNYNQQVWNALADELERGFNFISDYPMGSATPPELDGFNLIQFRQSVIKHYKVIYEIQDKFIVVMIVCHEKQNMTTQLQKRIFSS